MDDLRMDIGMKVSVKKKLARGMWQ